MANTNYHYTECGLDNIYLANGFNFRETPDGQAVSINDIDGLHKAIGLYLVTAKKDLSPKDVRFLRDELLMSQNTLGKLLGVSDQSVRRWEAGKTAIPKPSEYLLRLIYREKVHSEHNEISSLLKEIADLEDQMNNKQLLFVDTNRGWESAA